jgi:hypothetical protein
VLFRKQEHEPLAGGPWDERAARYAVADIVDDATAALSPREGGLYEGDEGEAYALQKLGATVEVRAPDHGDDFSYATGELGVALAAGDRDRAERAARECIESPANELLYGAAGALAAAVLLDLDDVARTAVERLWSTWTFDAKLRACIWTQELTGKRRQLLGAAHGVAGNAHALLRAARFQSQHHQTELLERVIEVLKRTAISERGLANWPPAPDSLPRELRVQWCHGAPGIVCALAGAPAHRELDAILLAAGELTWQAGPLRKGPGLCHGTAGNGFAFLKLFRRTRDPRWLERARRFAMHAIGQRRGERGLYEGDVGVALYLRACIEVDDRWPLLDVL